MQLELSCRKCWLLFVGFCCCTKNWLKEIELSWNRCGGLVRLSSFDGSCGGGLNFCFFNHLLVIWFRKSRYVGICCPEIKLYELFSEIGSARWLMKWKLLLVTLLINDRDKIKGKLFLSKTGNRATNPKINNYTSSTWVQGGQLRYN